MRRAAAFVVAALALLAACRDSPVADVSPRTEPTPASPRPAASPPRTRVAVVGDMGTGTESQDAVAGALCGRAPRLRAVVTTGDNVYDSGHPADFESKFFRPYACLFERDVPFHAALGNHDVVTGEGDAMVAEERFGMEGRYYSVSLGPLTFVVLDSTRLHEIQLRWLEGALRRARNTPWTVVVLHHPPYSGGAEHGSDVRARALLAPRFRRLGVDLVLSGHEHLYSRAVAAGVTYVVTGGGGAPLYPCAPEPPPEVVACRSVHHFVLLRATPGSLRLRAVAAGGATLDAAAVRARP